MLVTRVLGCHMAARSQRHKQARSQVTYAPRGKDMESDIFQRRDVGNTCAWMRCVWPCGRKHMGPGSIHIHIHLQHTYSFVQGALYGVLPNCPTWDR